ncbi:hypothetical protein MGI18_10375 [Bacillus sp. OVS6]|nr:hypothetical protein MGI18_10375 [Bacillus sp. OVS6]
MAIAGWFLSKAESNMPESEEERMIEERNTDKKGSIRNLRVFFLLGN